MPTSIVTREAVDQSQKRDRMAGGDPRGNRGLVVRACAIVTPLIEEGLRQPQPGPTMTRV